MDVQKELEKFNIKPDPLKDQFFLEDEEFLKQIVEFADLNKSDVVLDAGAGTGRFSLRMAMKVKHVFIPFLSKLPENVEVHYEDAWEYVQLHGKFRKKKEYNKVVANLPYSFIEPFLHNLTFLEYDKVILLIPVKLLNKIDNHGIFGSFFKTKVLIEVPKEKFYPIPRTNSVVIDLVKLPDPLKTKNLGLFMRQYIYQHEGQLVKNSLMEGLIKYTKLVYSKKLTKNEARKIIVQSGISEKLLKIPPNNSDIYDLVADKFDLGTRTELLKQIGPL